MNARTRGVLIGVGGLMAGGLTAALVDLPPLSKAGLVVLVCIVMSIALWLVFRPRAGA
jgi:hypothetical protein